MTADEQVRSGLGIGLGLGFGNLYSDLQSSAVMCGVQADPCLPPLIMSEIAIFFSEKSHLDPNWKGDFTHPAPSWSLAIKYHPNRSEHLPTPMFQSVSRSKLCIFLRVLVYTVHQRHLRRCAI